MSKLLQKWLLAALRWCGYALILAVFIGLPSYVAFHVGRMVGEGEGYKSCMDAAIFPTTSELDKVRRLFE